MLDEPAVAAERTPAQQQEDVDAAAAVLDLAEAQSADSDALDDYFPKIKSRFRLTSIGWEGDFQKGFEIAVKINPEKKKKPKKRLSGSGLPADMTHATKVDHQTDTLEGDTVGVKMTARPLGPDHGAGSGPKGQDKLMGKLPTGYQHNADAQSNYIRGHLLNDWLGGPGEAKNLFPITQHANTAHLAAMEKDVKVWVNEKRFWVAYDVVVTMGARVIDASVADNHVDATLTATAHVLAADLSPDPLYTRSVSIPSIFGKKPDVKTLAESAGTAALDAHAPRPEDLALTVQGTDRAGESGPPKLNPEIAADLGAALSKAGVTRAAIDTRLQALPGIAANRCAALWLAYDQNKLTPGLPLASYPQEMFASLTFVQNRWDELKKLLP